MQSRVIAIEEASGAAAIEQVRSLFREYAASLGVDLCFQGFEAELGGLPGAYARPAGALLLARVDGEIAGCGALRALPDLGAAPACELKRLYVRPAFRRGGLGRRLALELMARARRIGHSTMLLDTLDDMDAARRMYATLGFREIAPYCFNPIPGVHYLRADLGVALPGV
jgi:ribosomal protein S18 acetylase RimI-like enzyme